MTPLCNHFTFWISWLTWCWKPCFWILKNRSRSSKKSSTWLHIRPAICIWIGNWKQRLFSTHPRKVFMSYLLKPPTKVHSRWGFEKRAPTAANALLHIFSFCLMLHPCRGRKAYDCKGWNRLVNDHIPCKICLGDPKLHRKWEPSRHLFSCRCVPASWNDSARMSLILFSLG